MILSIKTKQMNYTQQQLDIVIDSQEEKVRNMFIQDFGRYFKSLDKLPIKSGIDLSGITVADQPCFIELKERSGDYSIQSLSASTFFEQKKGMDFRFINTDYPNAKLIYFNYFQTGGYISFNIKARIDNQSKEVIEYTPIPCRKTNYTNDCRIKNQHLLCYDPLIDVMKLNNN